MSERTVSVAEAAVALGISEKAVRRRIERKVLPSVLVDGKRRIPASAVGQSSTSSPAVYETTPDAPQRRASAPPAGSPAVYGQDMIDRLERLAREAGAARQLEVVTGHQEQQLIEANAKIVELEARLARRRPWFRRSPP